MKFTTEALANEFFMLHTKKEPNQLSNATQGIMTEFNPVKSLKDFQREIEQLAFEKRIDFMEAVLLYCEQTGMEIETAGSLIKSSAKMKARIQDEAEALNYFPKTDKLPL